MDRDQVLGEDLEPLDRVLFGRLVFEPDLLDVIGASVPRLVSYAVAEELAVDGRRVGRAPRKLNGCRAGVLSGRNCRLAAGNCKTERRF